MSNNKNSNSDLYIRGSIAGLIIGLLAAYFYAKAADENGNDKGISSSDFVKLGLAILGIVRQVTELGTGPGKK
ncbi:MAG: hypothetical protein K8L91_31095 [Anaerolineae bacterium]|nr:hypothetical protein [Anaerolineae bacterium]